MKVRFVYTVIREAGSASLGDLEDLKNGPQFEETGEYLYAGSGRSEKIGVALEVNTGSGWRTVREEKPN